MSYYDCMKKMKTLSFRQDKYSPLECECIINAIMGVYMVKQEVYLEDCVAAFSRFLKTGVLYI